MLMLWPIVFGYIWQSQHLMKRKVKRSLTDFYFEASSFVHHYQVLFFVSTCFQPLNDVYKEGRYWNLSEEFFHDTLYWHVGGDLTQQANKLTDANFLSVSWVSYTESLMWCKVHYHVHLTHLQKRCYNLCCLFWK